MLALGDIERHAARRADELVRERTVVAPDARNERAKGFDNLDAELCNLESHGVFLLHARETQAHLPSRKRAQAGSRAPKAPRAARAKPLDADEHAGTIKNGRRESPREVAAASEACAP